jgi:hypothetical protein
MLTLLREVDQSWFEGELNGKKGIFPKSYVEVLTPISKAAPGRPPQPAVHPTGPTARAKFKFTGDTPIELSFQKVCRKCTSVIVRYGEIVVHCRVISYHSPGG